MATAKKQRKKRKPPKKKAAVTAREFLRDLQEDHDSDQFTFFSDNVHATVEHRVPTGVLALDRLTGGGWPIGRMVEVAAWEGVGKSTLLDQSIAEVQRMGGMAALIDTEGARDLQYMETLGVDVDQLFRSRVNTIEECFGAIDKYLDRQEAYSQTRELRPLLIVWDSIGGTPTRAELEGGADDSHMMVAARSIKMNLRRIHHRLAPLQVALVCTNHFYRTIGPFASLKTYGGSGIQYFASLRLWLTNKGQLKIGTQVVGHQVEAKVKKSRLGAIPMPVIAGIVHGSGFDNSFTLFDWAREHGAEGDHRYVVQRGAWYTFSNDAADPDPVTFQRGFVGFGELLSEHPKLYAQLVTRYLST